MSPLHSSHMFSYHMQQNGETRARLREPARALSDSESLRCKICRLLPVSPLAPSVSQFISVTQQVDDDSSL